MLEPVRASFRSGTPIRWNRVHNLAGFVYFNHSIHIKKGVGCVTCHGQVDQMPLTWQTSTLQMEWCLQCHRNPEKYLRPRDYIFTMKTNEQLLQEFNAETSEETGKVSHEPLTTEKIPREALKDQLSMGNKLVEMYKVNKKTSCSVCHR